MLLTEQRLNTVIDLPIALPVTKVQAGDWITVATVELIAPAKLTLSQLQAHIVLMEAVSASDPCGGLGKNEINEDFIAGGLIAVFIAKNAAPDSRPDLQPYSEAMSVPSNFELAPDSTAPVFSSRAGSDALVLAESGLYSITVLNNTVNRNIHVSVNGILTIDLDPPA